MFIDPPTLLPGVTLITVPHMDDEVLACGGTIAKLPQKDQIHIIYATDGMGSPAPVLPWRDSVSADLGAARMKEARAAMAQLGVPQENIHFLNLPDSQLKHHCGTLYRLLKERVEQLKPAHVLAPFRYDRHPDHLALNQVVTTVCQQVVPSPELIEYFVYYRWRLLAEGDVRNYVHPECLVGVDIGDVSTTKRVALECFKTQTTKFYTWQTRPNLTARLIGEVSHTPEYFLRGAASLPGAMVFTRNVTWIRLAHRLEPFMKKKKDQVVALWRSGMRDGS